MVSLGPMMGLKTIYVIIVKSVDTVSETIQAEWGIYASVN